MMPQRVAIIADAHFHDPGGDFGGVGVMIGGHRVALRSWADVQAGARAVNETAMALTAALDRIAARGIRRVVLAGDYTDDGQTANTRRLARLLQGYQTTHDLRFYAIPGNHDVYGPRGKHVSTRFMTGPARSVLVTSDAQIAAAHAPDAVLTPAMRCGGLPDALQPMAAFGLYRQPEHLHWESPFGLSDADDARCYDAQAADGSVTHRLMDASYLVEPEPGLWLLMIDANVFEPRPGRTDPSRKKAFLDASDAGWNAVLRLKPFLLPWIADVTARARLADKTLVTVSHYPVLDPFQDDAGSEVALFGQTAIARRTPLPAVADALSAAGLQWHAGGHMHVNATAHRQTPVGGLTDLSLPSLAAFPPAFTVITASQHAIHAETCLLADLPVDPDLQDFYARQGRSGAPAPDYATFLAMQYRAHVATHVLPRDWPADLSAMLRDADCAALLALLSPTATAAFAQRHGFTPADLLAYPLIHMVTDAYLIRNAGPLAAPFIDPARIRLCRALADDFGDATVDPHATHAAFLGRFLSILGVSLRRMDAA